MAVEKGVKIALGSDTVYEPLTKYGEYSAKEFKALVECGLTVPEAIRAATLGSAKALNMSHKIGTVEVGKEADLLVIRKDPTESADVLYNAENIYLTFLKGRSPQRPLDSGGRQVCVVGRTLESSLTNTKYENLDFIPRFSI